MVGMEWSLRGRDGVEVGGHKVIFVVRDGASW